VSRDKFYSWVIRDIIKHIVWQITDNNNILVLSNDCSVHVLPRQLLRAFLVDSQLFQPKPVRAFLVDSQLSQPKPDRAFLVDSQLFQPKLLTSIASVFLKQLHDKQCTCQQNVKY